jgi:hypothetical protein
VLTAAQPQVKLREAGAEAIQVRLETAEIPYHGRSPGARLHLLVGADRLVVPELICITYRTCCTARIHVALQLSMLHCRYLGLHCRGTTSHFSAWLLGSVSRRAASCQLPESFRLNYVKQEATPQAAFSHKYTIFLKERTMICHLVTSSCGVACSTYSHAGRQPTPTSSPQPDHRHVVSSLLVALLLHKKDLTQLSVSCCPQGSTPPLAPATTPSTNALSSHALHTVLLSPTSLRQYSLLI